MMKKIITVLMASIAMQSVAEDTEIYLGNSNVLNNQRPKVLMIFDNSGSMRSERDIKTPYDPSTNYPAVNGLTKLAGDYLYYVKGEVTSKPIPDDPNEKRRIIVDVNSCKTAKDKLDTVGYYIGYVREYSFIGETGSWKELPENDATNVNVIDCWDDVRLADDTNASIKDSLGALTTLPNGYPVDGKGDTSNPIYYTSTLGSSNTKLGAGEIVTLYSENYLRWNHNTGLGTVKKAKMDIAKEAVTALVDAAPTVDFALEVFNHNHGDGYRNGGRIAYAFKDFGVTEANEFKDIVNDLVPFTWTPLCESLYEAYRYFSGSSVYYGDDDSDHSGSGSNHFYDASDHVQRDTDAENGSGSYVSPYNSCSNKISVIMITDGEPTNDGSANSLVSGLPGNTTGGSQYGGNYLTSLAKWMHENDIDQDATNGTQTADLYTVGFSLDATSTSQLRAINLLTEAANAGGGRYLDASDPSDLLSELQSALVSILQADGSFTAPSVASNNFDRTETLDSVYYAMFTPDKGPRWQGNLKKLRIEESGLVDKNGNTAIDAASGNINVNAKTLWSSAVDGSSVGKGGVVEWFQSKTPSDRTIYSDLGANRALVPFTKSNATSSSAYGSDVNLASAMGITTSEIDDYLNWAKGQDLDDEDKDGAADDMRLDVFGDPIHSKPLVINYGAASAGAQQDLRIIIGTNAGALHMFRDRVDTSGYADTVEETWAFMPKEFFKDYKTLRENFSSSDKVYALDGTPVAHIVDTNGDGQISAANGDKAYVFFGLRRGGSSYYGIDVTDPDNPTMLWHIDSSNSNFNEIKQSWSTPRIAYSKINMSGSTPKPVLIFAAGYDTNKDDQSSPGTNDSKGRGVYMLDAESGSLLWSMTPSTTVAFPGVDSVPSSVATLDSDSDGFVDRLYFGDTGGNVWRIDMLGTVTSNWQATKLASVGGTSHESDRRFFAEPTIARAVITETFTKVVNTGSGPQTQFHKIEKPYEAILIGSGDRTNPLDELTDDMLFMIKDENILTQKFTTAPDTIELSDLYNYTADPFGALDKTASDYEEQFNSLASAVSEKDGWYIDLAQKGGEKNVAKAEAVAGVAYFNSYAPPLSSGSSCQINSAGFGYLYAVDLALGTDIYAHGRILEVNSALTDGITVVTMPEGTNNSNQPTNSVEGNPLAILAGEALKLLDADGNEGVRLKTVRTSLALGENN